MKIIDRIIDRIVNRIMYLVEGHISKRHSCYSTQCPDKALFDRIEKIMRVSIRNSSRRDPLSPKKAVEDIAKAQGRDVIYICPDRTMRNSVGDVIGEKAEHGVIGIPPDYRACLPVTFTTDESFNDWLKEVTKNVDID